MDSNRAINDIRRKIKVSTINQSDDNGVSPLHLAVYAENSAVLQMLLNNSAVQVDKRDKFGQTPLHYAVKNFNLSAVEGRTFHWIR